MTASSRNAWTQQVAGWYEAYARELWALYYTICSDPERSTEAVQEAFLRLQEHRGEPIRDPKGWLLFVGRNWLRDQARRKASSVKSNVEFHDLTESHSGPEEEFFRHELQLSMREALAELREEDREVLVLRYALGWSSQRIGEQLGVRAASVDMRLTRARQRLAAVLNRMQIEPPESD